MLWVRSTRNASSTGYFGGQSVLASTHNNHNQFYKTFNNYTTIQLDFFALFASCSLGYLGLGSDLVELIIVHDNYCSI